MTKDERAELMALAKAATPGPVLNHAYIAATRPAAIIPLLERVERLETTLDLIREEAFKDNAPLGRSDSLAIDRIRVALTMEPSK